MTRSNAAESVAADSSITSLPDYLREGLRIVFVGINPSIYSAQKGHYFARNINRFWPALSRSRLSESIRRALGKDLLGPEDDASLLDFGIGFTDVVKRPSRNISELTPQDFQAGAPLLLQKLAATQPSIACFHGMMGYRPFVRHGLGRREMPKDLGPQNLMLGLTRVFVVPSPSPANAHFTPEDQARWYDALFDYCESHPPNGG